MAITAPTPMTAVVLALRPLVGDELPDRPAGLEDLLELECLAVLESAGSAAVAGWEQEEERRKGTGTALLLAPELAAELVASALAA
uniref:Uncharacterized protein n=1 Tax=Oryza brachyantha TaxID=4533 RepID=J3M334_ORYBR